MRCTTLASGIAMWHGGSRHVPSRGVPSAAQPTLIGLDGAKHVFPPDAGNANPETNLLATAKPVRYATERNGAAAGVHQSVRPNAGGECRLNTAIGSHGCFGAHRHAPQARDSRLASAVIQQANGTLLCE